jgi:hypothetical protein
MGKKVKQPYDGKYWDPDLHICTRHRDFSIHNRWSFCLLCKISELENQLEFERETVGLLRGENDLYKEEKGGDGE